MLTISSGPRLMVDRTQFEKSQLEMPGEGRTYTSKEEGTKVWKNKTLRKYHEPVPKQHKERRNPEYDAIEYRSDRSDRSDGFRSLYRNHRALPATDDQKMVSAEDLDKIFLEREIPKGFNELQNSPSYSYIPTVRDVAIQCNRKKSSRHLNTSSDNDSYVRVIKSSNDGFVTAYSDVPQLKSEKPSKRTPISKHEVWSEGLPQSEAIYSKVDKTKKKSFREDTDRSDKYSDLSENYPTVIYRTPLNERRVESPSGFSHYSKYSGRGSEYSTNTNRTLKNKTKGIGFTFKSGIDGPKVNLPKSSPKLRSRSLNRYEEQPTRDWRDDSLNRSGPRKEVTQEVLEETISISNASSDDFEPYHPNRSFDEFLEPKPHFKEIERKRKDISFVSTLPNQRRLTTEKPIVKAIEDDYRRDLASNVIIYPTGSDTSYSTLSRFDKKKDSKLTDFTPPPRQAYTLDRRHLKERQQKTETVSNTKLKEVNPRLHKSTADLTEHSRRDDTRGGLANAYRNRQQEKRPSSLNRMSAIREGRMSPSGHSTPIRYLSQNHLNSAGNSLNSSSESDTLNRHKRHYIHDREPIVMYIPAVSHHNKRAEDESDRISGILRPSSRSGCSASSIRKYGKKLPKSSASDLTPSKPRDYSSKYSNYGSHRPHNDEELDQVEELKDTKNFGKLKKGKSILNRRHSIPKDTKFPWLQKLKSKVKFRE